MRPSWMRCDQCLFGTPDGCADNLLCSRSPNKVMKNYSDFCGSWICVRCLRPWREINFSYTSPERTNGREYIVIKNHGKLGCDYDEVKK